MNNKWITYLHWPVNGVIFVTEKKHFCGEDASENTWQWMLTSGGHFFPLSIGLHLLHACFVSSLFLSPLLVNRSVHQSASSFFFCLKTCTHILQKPVTPINVHRNATLYTQCQSIEWLFFPSTPPHTRETNFLCRLFFVEFTRPFYCRHLASVVLTVKFNNNLRAPRCELSVVAVSFLYGWVDIRVRDSFVPCADE